ncbi:MAG: hypothetical protein ACLSH3_15720 [Alistipes finegoldii]
MQFIFAGKAHPNDKPGQDLIKRIVEVAAMPQFTGKIIFLQNYDMELARRMVQGVDVWLNTPDAPARRLREPSGEKCRDERRAAVLACSTAGGSKATRKAPDGCLPMERTFTDQHHQDELDAEMIYNTIIEEQIAPKYYAAARDNIPVRMGGFGQKMRGGHRLELHDQPHADRL